jgi:AcrR family transcriptional regulator
MSKQRLEVPSAGTRRRGVALERAIINATWELLAEGNHERLTMAAIADRAGTSKPVLYRRWTNRTDLILAALRNKTPTPQLANADHGTLRADLIALLHSAAAWFTGLPPGVVHSLRAAMAVDPELRALLAMRIDLVDIRPALFQALERAARRGETDGGPVGDRALRLPLDLMFLESMNQLPVAEPDKVIAEIIDQIMLPLLTARVVDPSINGNDPGAGG